MTLLAYFLLKLIKGVKTKNIMGGVSKTISITQIMETLANEQDPLSPNKLDQVESLLYDGEYTDSKEGISYTDWLAIQENPEFKSLFKTSSSDEYSGLADELT